MVKSFLEAYKEILDEIKLCEAALSYMKTDDERFHVIENYLKARKDFFVRLIFAEVDSDEWFNNLGSDQRKK